MDQTITFDGWRGLNLGAGPHDLDDSESPDTTNTFYHDGKLGLLGPRKGKLFLRPTGQQTILGTIPWTDLTGTARYLVADQAGTISDTPVVDDPATIQNWVVSAAGSTTTAVPATVTLTYPANTVSGTFAFTGAVTYNAANAIFGKWVGALMTIDMTGNRPWSNRINSYFGLIVNGAPFYVVRNTNIYTESSASRRYRLETSQSYARLASYIPTTGTISGIALKADLDDGVWDPDMTAGEVVVSCTSFG
jgi:hypothetical protein